MSACEEAATEVKPALIPSSYHPHFGGVEEVTRQLAVGLVRRGHDPLVLTNRWPKALATREIIDEVTVIRRPFRVPHPSARGIGGWLAGSALTGRALVGDSRAHACDLVNVHCVSSNGRYALAISKALDVPLVVSVHGELSGDATNLYARSAVQRRTFRLLLDAADVVTAPSAHSLGEAERAYGTALGSRGRVIRNGVELDLFGGSRMDNSDAPFVFAVGRLAQNKGFDVLIDAWGLLPSSLGQLTLIIGGAGSEQQRLAQQIAASPVATRIRLVGQLDRREVARFMKTARTVVVPSRAESLGLVALEAMAAGAPVVAAAVGGLPEVVIDGVTGLLFESGSAASLAEALTKMLTEYDHQQRMTSAGLARVQNLSWTACTELFVEAYTDAALQHRLSS